MMSIFLQILAAMWLVWRSTVMISLIIIMIMLVPLKTTNDTQKLAPANKIGIFDLTNSWQNKHFCIFLQCCWELCLLFQSFKIIRIIIILGVNTGFIWVKPNEFHDVITKQLHVQIEIGFLLTFKPTSAIILAYEHNNKVLTVQLLCSYSLQIMKIKNHRINNYG